MNTDSLLYCIENVNVYDQMQWYTGFLDTSDYPEDHRLYSDKNKKALGKLKDETHGDPILDFICETVLFRRTFWSGKEAFKGDEEIRCKKEIWDSTTTSKRYMIIRCTTYISAYTQQTSWDTLHRGEQKKPERFLW